MRNSTAGLVTMTKLVAVNKSKGLFLPSDLSSLSQTWDIMGDIHNPHAHTARRVTLPGTRICLAL